MNDREFKHTEAHKLEDPERLKWLPPAEILAHLRLGPGMKVADIGAGTGYFSIPIARAVGALGHVFAVDLQPEIWTCYAVGNPVEGERDSALKSNTIPL